MEERLRMKKENGAKVKNEEGKGSSGREWRRKREERLRMEKLKGVKRGRGGGQSIVC